MESPLPPLPTATAVAFGIFLFLVLIWLLGCLPFRKHPWAIGGWIPISGLAGLATLGWLGILLAGCSPGSGAAGGFGAMGAAIALRMLLPVPLFLGLCVYIRPRGPYSNWATLWGSLLLIVIVTLAVHFKEAIL